MKFIAMCAAAALSLSMISCGGSYDNEKVKAINDAKSNEYTEEQQEYGLELYLAFQQEEIDELKDQISNIEDEIAKQKAVAAAGSVYSATSAKGQETEAYKKVQDDIKKNAQEITNLKKELKKAKVEAYKKLGYDDDAKNLENQADPQ